MKLKTFTIFSFGIAILAGDSSNAAKVDMERRDFRNQTMQASDIEATGKVLPEWLEFKKKEYFRYDKSKGEISGTDLKTLRSVIALLPEEEKKKTKIRFEIPEGYSPAPEVKGKLEAFKDISELGAYTVPAEKFNSLWSDTLYKLPTRTFLRFNCPKDIFWGYVAGGKKLKDGNFDQYYEGAGYFGFVTGDTESLFDKKTGKPIIEYSHKERVVRIKDPILSKEVLANLDPNARVKIKFEALDDLLFNERNKRLGFVYKEENGAGFYVKDVPAAEGLQSLNALRFTDGSSIDVMISEQIDKQIANFLNANANIAM
ncbi:MAG: hypothetical protein JSS34_00970 [Proteobacteria bacterium]|nr:hypothetical protein [Pseudomonadota bacterium]